MERRVIHAIVHVHGDLPVMLPLLRRMKAAGKYALGVTLKYPDHLPKVIFRDRDRALLKRHDIEYAEDYTWFERFLHTQGPRLLLTAADDAGGHHAIGRDCVDRAKQAGIPTMVLQHGGWSTDDIWEICKRPQYAFSSDRILLWGEWFYEGYIRRVNLEAGRLRVVGSPKFDDLHSADIDSTNHLIRGRLQIEGCPYIVYPVSCLIGIKRRGNFSEQETVEVVRNIVRAVVTKYDNSVLIIKPHPTDFEYGVAELVQRALHGISQHKYRLLSSEDISCLVEIIKGSSLTIVNQSTAAFESLALNVPVISVIPDRISPGNDALHDGIVYTSIVAPIEHIFEQLVRTLPDCLTDRHLTDECQRHLMKFLYKNDGRSSERVMREMDEMMDRWFA